MKNTVHIFLWALLLLGLVAFGCMHVYNDDPENSATDTDTDTDTDSDGDADGDTDSESDWETDEDEPPTLEEICAEAPVLGPDAHSVVDSTNIFGANLFREVVSRAGGANLSISPISLHTVWSMTYNGAKNNTATEIHDALGMGSLVTGGLNSGYLELLTSLKQQDAAVTLTMANSVWMKDTFAGNILPEFILANETYYDADVETLNFSDPGAADIMNQWVSDNTNGYIDDLIASPIPLNVIMYLINAVYFASPWTYRFDESATTEETFFNGAGGESSVQMMHTNACLPFFQNADFEMVQLPYGDGIYAMSVILPVEGVTVDDVVSTFTDENWQQWQEDTYIAEMTLDMPRFEIEFDAINGNSEGLIDSLKALGIIDVFMPWDADLSGIAPTSPPEMNLYVSDTKQKTFVQVQEEGTEAAAASMVEVSIAVDGDADGPPQRDMTVDRPFLFAIHDRCNGAVLFIGQVTDPPPVSI